MNPQSTVVPSLSEFIKKLIEEKGLDNIDEEIKKQVASDLQDRLQRTIQAKIVERLAPDQLTQFEQLLDRSAPDEETQSFLGQSIPGYQNFIAGILLDFRRVYLG